MQAAQMTTAHYRRPLLHTPFYPRSRDHVETDAYVAWSGYSLPDVYSSVEQEYFAIRNSAALIDLSPMIKYHITGADAERFLNRLVTRDVTRQRLQQVTYTVWCNDAGQVIDDGTLFRSGGKDFHLCTAGRQLDWLLDSALGFEVTVRDVTEEVAAVALQGPTSCAILKALGLEGIAHLEPFAMAFFDFAGFPLMVSRTGFTGDLGYELWIAPEAAIPLWDRLMDAGRDRGIRPTGIRALDMARLEAGYILSGTDFLSAAQTVLQDRETTPYELGLDRLVAMDKGHFTGRRSLLVEQARGPRRRLMPIEVDGRKPAHAALLYAEREGNTQIGAVTSAMWSPTCKRNIALVMIDAPHWRDFKACWADIYLHRELRWERRMEKAWPVKRPFFAPERSKMTPAPDR